MFVECCHIKPRGMKCKSPALRGTSFCYFHTSLYRSRYPSVSDDKEPITLPSLEDSIGIQLALHQVLGALGSSRIDPRRAGLYLRGLQLAAHLAATPAPRSVEEPVRDLIYESNGDALAPEKTTCEPPEDCPTCKERNQCEDFEDYEDEVAELEKCAESEKSRAS